MLSDTVELSELVIDHHVVLQGGVDFLRLEKSLDSLLLCQLGLRLDLLNVVFLYYGCVFGRGSWLLFDW